MWLPKTTNKYSKHATLIRLRRKERTSLDLSLSAASLTAIYQERWKVEQYHKSLKSDATFAGSPTKLPGTRCT